VLRSRLHTAINALDALERFEFAEEFGMSHSPQKREAAINTIEQAVLHAAEAIGIQQRARTHPPSKTPHD
jgi:hypothetical protein